MFIKPLKEIAGTPAWGRDVGLDYAVYPASLFDWAGVFFLLFTQQGEVAHAALL